MDKLVSHCGRMIASDLVMKNLIQSLLNGDWTPFKSTLLTVITGTQHSPGFIDHNVERITLMRISNLLIHFLYCVITKHEPTRLVFT